MPIHHQSCTACDWRGDVIVAVGEHPPCPMCASATERCWSGSRVQTVPDDIPGGRWFENGFDVPTRFDSHSAHRAALDASGQRIRAKWAGPLDRYLIRWDAPTQKTLDDAKVLLSRGHAEAAP